LDGGNELVHFHIVLREFGHRHLAIAALVNAVLGVFLFVLFDRLRRN